ncbi:protein zwilch homolog [Mizuhopecten yessoensis]|uniref:Protein zwilch n=1 Tax=Mizuhopecten yessoensis TaxID=6573 RepID=A0A210Q970_MIZYE|nr:protein zwilch homolog [Mizuhopecten yessoensis]OWF45290.1 Protein zwilch-like [Mizuhopecten yessoensis]
MDEQSIIEFKEVVETLLCNPDRRTKVEHNETKFSVANEEILNDVVPSQLFEFQFPVILVSSVVDADVTEEEFYVPDLGINNDISTRSRPARSVSHSQSEVEGSPLKLQTYADFSFSSPSSDASLNVRKRTVVRATGVPLDKARELASYLSLAYSSKVSDHIQSKLDSDATLDDSAQAINKIPSLFILCDGLDHKRTACMYIEPIYLKATDSNKWTGWKVSSIYVKDPESDESHMPNFHKLDLSGKQIECEAKYDLFESHQENDRQPIDKYQGSLQLEVRWKKLTSAPPLDARTIIKAKVLPGDIRSAAHSLYNTLEALKLHVAGLTTSEIKWIEYEEETPVMDKLKALLEILKHGDASQLANSDDEQNDEEFNNVMDTLVFHERKDLDFTDHLWTVLYKCSSYSELVECFKYVFTVLSNGELRPMVHRNNNTTVAQMVRDSYMGKLRMPNLAGVYALQLLAEIGAEKLHQDYLFTFLAKELVTHSNLEDFLKTDVKLEQKLINLEKMHHVLEMVVMLKLFLNLPSLNLAICARAMLAHYQQEDISPSHVFAFPMLTPSLKHAFETCQPCMKQMVLAKMVGDMKESVHHLLVTHQPFHHLPASVDPEVLMDTTVNKNKKYFYVRKNESISILI